MSVSVPRDFVPSTNVTPSTQDAQQPVIAPSTFPTLLSTLKRNGVLRKRSVAATRETQALVNFCSRPLDVDHSSNDHVVTARSSPISQGVDMLSPHSILEEADTLTSPAIVLHEEESRDSTFSASNYLVVPTPPASIDVGGVHSVSGMKRARSYLPERVDCDCEDSHAPGSATCTLCMVSPMICCDGCNRWMHLACIGLQDTDVPIGVFLCNRCDGRKHKKVAKKSKVKPKVMQWNIGYYTPGNPPLRATVPIPPLHPRLLEHRLALMRWVNQHRSDPLPPRIEHVVVTRSDRPSAATPSRFPKPQSKASTLHGNGSAGCAPSTCMTEMPDVILRGIVAFLPVSDRSKLACTNKRMKTYFLRGLLADSEVIDFTAPHWMQKHTFSSMLCHAVNDANITRIFDYRSIGHEMPSSTCMLDLSFCSALSSEVITGILQAVCKTLQTLKLRFLPFLSTHTFTSGLNAAAAFSELRYLDVTGCGIQLGPDFLRGVGQAAPKLRVLQACYLQEVSADTTWKSRATSGSCASANATTYAMAKLIGLLQLLHECDSPLPLSRNDANELLCEIGAPPLSTERWLCLLSLCMDNPVADSILPLRIPFAELCLLVAELPISEVSLPEDVAFGSVAAPCAVVFPCAMRACGFACVLHEHLPLRKPVATYDVHDDVTPMNATGLQQQEKNVAYFTGPELLSGSELSALLWHVESRAWAAKAPSNTFNVDVDRKFPVFVSAHQSALGAFSPNISSHPLSFVPGFDVEPTVSGLSVEKRAVLVRGLQLTQDIETAREGIALLESVSSDIPDARLHAYIAGLFDRLYCWKDCWRQCEAAITLNPEFGSVALQIAGILTQAGHTELIDHDALPDYMRTSTLMHSTRGAHDWLDRAEGSTTFLAGSYHHLFHERAVVLLRQTFLEDAIDAFHVAMCLAPWGYAEADIAADFKKALLAKRERDLRKQSKASSGYV